MKFLVLKVLFKIDFSILLYQSPDCNGRDHYGAEGATTPETLRQKDRYRNNSGKQA